MYMATNYYIGDEEILIPDVPTTIVGFRQWKADYVNLLLKSRVTWPHNDVLKAECISNHYMAWNNCWGNIPFATYERKMVPDKDIDNHLIPSAPNEMVKAREASWNPDAHAWTYNEDSNIVEQSHQQPGCGIYSFKTLEHLMEHPFYGSYHNKGIITGTIEIGGRVWPHQKGYRSEYAMIAGIYCVNRKDFEIAMKYQLEVLYANNEKEEKFLDKYRISDV